MVLDAGSGEAKCEMNSNFGEETVERRSLAFKVSLCEMKLLSPYCSLGKIHTRRSEEDHVARASYVESHL